MLCVCMCVGAYVCACVSECKLCVNVIFRGCVRACVCDCFHAFVCASVFVCVRKRAFVSLCVREYELS